MSKVVHARKKPVTIQAIRTSDVYESRHPTHWGELPPWLADGVQKGRIVFADDGIYAGLDDWVLCGIKGEIYPCKNDIFEHTYDIIA